MGKKYVPILFMLIASLSCALIPTPETIIETVEVTKIVSEITVVTATPQPLSTATPLPATLLEDNFDAGDGEWYLEEGKDYSIYVANGELVLTSYAPNFETSTGHPDLDFFNKPFEMNVEITFVDGAVDSYAGIDFRVFDEDNYAEFLISADGFATLGLFFEGEWYDIMAWSSVRSLRSGTNEIRLIDTGSRVIAYANGELIFDVPLSDLGPSGIYFLVGTYDDGRAEWTFDNLEIREVN